MSFLRRIAYRIQNGTSPVILVLVAGVVFLIAVGGAAIQARSSNDKHAITSVASTTSTTTRHIDGFGNVQLITKNKDGVEKTYCAALADNAQSRAQGMMKRQNLSGYDAMVFKFDSDSTSAFWMHDVPVALSVAWFDSAGNYVSSIDMPVCEKTANECPRYIAANKYLYAVEVLEGGLPAIGISAGSSIHLGGSC